MTQDTPEPNSGTPMPNPTEQHAAYWAVRSEAEDFTDLERKELQDWLDADSTHVQAFLDQIALGAYAGEVPLAARATLRRVSAARPLAPHSRFRPYRMMLAASVVFAAVGGLWLWRAPDGAPSPPATYVTDVGGQRTVVFPDGSTATLNTLSELSWLGGTNERRVDLARGEALFHVVRDSTKPFRLLMDDVEVRVLGTEFNAYRKASGELVISVLEGTIDVARYGTAEAALWRARVHADQQLTVRTQGPPVLRKVVANNAIRWRDGQLMLQDKSLGEVVEELGRYTHHRIVIDPRLSQTHVGGDLVPVHDTKSALELLTRGAPIGVKWNEESATYTLTFDEGRRQ